MNPEFGGFERFEPIRVPLSQLHEDPDNLNQHTSDDLDATFRSLKGFGQVETLVMHKSTGKIIGGNGRLRSMKNAGWKDALVIPVEGTPDQLEALAIALNKTPKNSEFDFGRLVDRLQHLEQNAPAELLAATGFMPHELEPLLAAEMNMGTAIFEDAEYEVPEEDAGVDSTKLAERGMTVQFTVLQKPEVDRLIMKVRLLSGDMTKSPADCLMVALDAFLHEEDDE